MQFVITIMKIEILWIFFQILKKLKKYLKNLILILIIITLINFNKKTNFKNFLYI